MDQFEFIRRFCQRPRNFAWFLGAGVSRKPYTEDEERSLSEIIEAFRLRQGADFTKKDFLRFEQVNQEILDEDTTEMLRNNPPYIVFTAFPQVFFEGAIRMLQRDSEMSNIILTDAEVRQKAIRRFFGRALREIREAEETIVTSSPRSPELRFRASRRQLTRRPPQKEFLGRRSCRHHRRRAAARSAQATAHACRISG